MAATAVEHDGNVYATFGLFGERVQLGKWWRVGALARGALLFRGWGLQIEKQANRRRAVGYLRQVESRDRK